MTGGFFGGQLIRVGEKLGAASGAGPSCRSGPLTSAPCSACPVGQAQVSGLPRAGLPAAQR